MPMFVKAAVTDMHRCDSCVVWTSMCRVFETSRKQVSFILAREVAEIDHGKSQLLVLHFAILHLARTRVE